MKLSEKFERLFMATAFAEAGEFEMAESAMNEKADEGIGYAGSSVLEAD